MIELPPKKKTLEGSMEELVRLRTKLVGDLDVQRRLIELATKKLWKEGTWGKSWKSLRSRRRKMDKKSARQQRDDLERIQLEVKEKMQLELAQLEQRYRIVCQEIVTREQRMVESFVQRRWSEFRVKLDKFLRERPGRFELLQRGILRELETTENVAFFSKHSCSRVPGRTWRKSSMSDILKMVSGVDLVASTRDGVEWASLVGRGRFSLTQMFLERFLERRQPLSVLFEEGIYMECEDGIGCGGGGGGGVGSGSVSDLCELELMRISGVTYSSNSLPTGYECTDGSNIGEWSSTTRTELDRELQEELGEFHIAMEDLNFGVKVGEGAFGEVFRGTLLGAKKDVVAIKRFKHSLSADPRLRLASFRSFVREITCLKRAEKIGSVVRFRGATTGPWWCIVTEFCARGSLFQEIHARKTRPSYRQALEWAIDIAKAVDTMHQMRPQLIHRDLTTHNVLITQEGAIRVADFGVARNKEKRGAQIMSLIGHPRYRAPEISLHEPYTKEVDSYQMGTIIFELLTGRRPFEDVSEDRQVAQMRAQSINPTIPADVPMELRKLMLSCWRRKPKSRPRMRDIVARLEQALRRAARLKVSEAEQQPQGTTTLRRSMSRLPPPQLLVPSHSSSTSPMRHKKMSRTKSWSSSMRSSVIHPSYSNFASVQAQLSSFLAVPSSSHVRSSSIGSSRISSLVSSCEDSSRV